MTEDPTDQKDQAALAQLMELHKSKPMDPTLNYKIACLNDKMGNESTAAPFYETALANGLSGEDRKNAMLGLGSTYRCLGEYESSLRVLNQAVTEFPDERALNVFRSLTLNNLGRSNEAITALLQELLDTTTDSSIKSYERALRFYSDKLDQIWK